MNKQTKTRPATLRVVNSKIKQAGSKAAGKKLTAKSKAKPIRKRASNGIKPRREEAKRNPRQRWQPDARRRRAAASSSSSSA